MTKTFLCPVIYCVKQHIHLLNFPLSTWCGRIMLRSVYPFILCLAAAYESKSIPLYKGNEFYWTSISNSITSLYLLSSICLIKIKKSHWTHTNENKTNISVKPFNIVRLGVQVKYKYYSNLESFRDPVWRLLCCLFVYAIIQALDDISFGILYTMIRSSVILNSDHHTKEKFSNLRMCPSSLQLHGILDFNYTEQHGRISKCRTKNCNILTTDVHFTSNLTNKNDFPRWSQL